MCLATIKENIISDQEVCLQDLEPCNTQEAGKCMLLRTLHAPQSFHKTKSSRVFLKISEPWTEFDTGNVMCYIPTNKIIAAIEVIIAQAFDFNGCATTLSLKRKEK